jgi:hypothetical protein
MQNDCSIPLTLSLSKGKNHKVSPSIHFSLREKHSGCMGVIIFSARARVGLCLEVFLLARVGLSCGAGPIYSSYWLETRVSDRDSKGCNVTLWFAQMKKNWMKPAGYNLLLIANLSGFRAASPGRGPPSPRLWRAGVQGPVLRSSKSEGGGSRESTLRKRRK